MAVNGQNGSEWLEMAGDCLNGCKWIEMDGNGWR